MPRKGHWKTVPHFQCWAPDFFGSPEGTTERESLAASVVPPGLYCQLRGQ
jgi:hypothetical protein